MIVKLVLFYYKRNAESFFFQLLIFFTVMKDAVTKKIPNSKYVLFVPDIALEIMGVTNVGQPPLQQRE